MTRTEAATTLAGIEEMEKFGWSVRIVQPARTMHTASGVVTMAWLVVYERDGE